MAFTVQNLITLDGVRRLDGSPDAKCQLVDEMLPLLLTLATAATIRQLWKNSRTELDNQSEFNYRDST